MAIEYVAAPKRITKGGEARTVYTATLISSGHKNVQSIDLAGRLAKNSCLAKADILAILNQLPEVMNEAMKDGQRVTINGLGTFGPCITAGGTTETPEALTPDKLSVTRVTFCADRNFQSEIMKAKFVRKNKKQPNKKTEL